MRQFTLPKKDEEFCKNILKTHSITYYNSTKLFPKHIQTAVFALYAWVRTADELVDNPKKDPVKELTKFERLYERSYKKGTSKDRITKIFIKLVNHFKFEERWAVAFIESMKLDFYHNEYHTPEELECYVFGSAEVIGMMMSRIMGVKNEHIQAARNLGTWMQHVNFLRDIDEDYKSRKRVYLPTSVLHTFNLTPQNLFDEENKSKLREMILWESKRLLTQIPQLKNDLFYIPKSSRTAILLSIKLYQWTITQINKNPDLPLSKQLKPSKSVIVRKLIESKLIVLLQHR